MKAVAAVFLLEARSCGRTGQTFFVGAKTRPATVEGKQQVMLFHALTWHQHKPRHGTPLAIWAQHYLLTHKGQGRCLTLDSLQC